MSVEVVIKITQGTSGQTEYCYDGSESIIIGRQADCGIILQEATVSRFHCLLEIAAPEIKLQDFGSRNGTFRISAGKNAVPSEETQVQKFETITLLDGDTVFIGKDCALSVHVREEKGRHRCKICGKGFFDENAEVEICSTCMKNEMAVMHYLLREAGPVRKRNTGPDIGGYQKIRLLGAGATGEAWLLADPANGRQVVCKRLLQAEMLGDRKRQRFLREAAIGAQLSHPNVVGQFGSGEDDNVPYILMEYCPGGSVADYMDRCKVTLGAKLSISMATHIVLQVLKALEYVHAVPVETTLANGEKQLMHGVVHRDIKPGNIFMMDYSEKAEVKLADFGFAKAFEAAGMTKFTSTGERAGTWDFTPRMQINDYRYAKPDVDIWSTAATYYYLLTGSPPKDTLGVPNPLPIALNTNATPIQRRNPQIPQRLAEVIDFALGEPENRSNIQSAAEFRRMIEAAL